ncbi:MAG: N-acetyl-gamma-glutamyl-phosphate reductase [Deltaproteobacteria bacterium]|nr:MAG: N-acetyl-gamma-glutamyl-phosphate reductase [Deltaproteobacteria bacterium]
MEAVRPATRTPVSVLGATGYTGVELLRLLAQHPAVELAYLSSEQYRGRRASEVYPFLAGIVDEALGAPEPAAAAAGDVVFTALPHGAAAPLARELLRRGRRVIDLSPDFRLRDAAVYARWYGEHPAPELLPQAVYGLPELYRDQLRPARLVANPGCYPTAALLGLAPLARAGLLSAPAVIDAKSGTTGAGRAAKVEQLFAEVNENFRPYAIAAHRHGPEIEQELRAAGAAAPPLFVPHLLPVSRGILATMYVRVPGGKPQLDSLFETAYAREPFVVLRGDGPPPELREVRGTNRCVLGWRWDEATGHAVVVSAIDNLGKGAAGQAVQCLNLLLGLPETTGLEAPALVP